MQRLNVHQPELEGRRPWVPTLRSAAAACYESLGLPTAKDEFWKYTNVSRLLEIPFATPGQSTAPHGWQSWLMSDAASLVLVGGRHAAELGTGAVRERWRLDSLARASRNDRAIVEPHLGRIADFRAHAFVALNTAMMTDGALVYAPPHTEVPVPVQVLHILPAGQSPAAFHPRVLIVAAEGSKLTVMETWVGADGGSASLNVPVTEIALGENARVDHYVMLNEGAASRHLGSVHVEQSRGSTLSSTLVLSGGVIARREVHTAFRGGDARCELQGVYTGMGGEHVDVRTVVDHAVARCGSTQRFRGVLGGEASSVFHGRVIVRPDAAKSEASQHNANLLLSDGATANSRPQLEILADDVRCSHGATVGQLDEDAMFYLRTRGLDERQAKRLLTRAFASEILEGMGQPWARETAGRWIEQRVKRIIEGGGGE